MVLPLVPVVLGASALASAVAGLLQAHDAKKNFTSANDIAKLAQGEWAVAAKALEARREEVFDTLTRLGCLRLQIASKSIARFAHLVDQIATSDIKTIDVANYTLPVETIAPEALHDMSYGATEFAKHGAQSLSAGAMVGLGVGNTVTALGAASTGTAISSLSGAAASNATMAWLGGGSLASGGLGMAGGTVVLGGVVAGPVLMVLGYLAAGHSEKALTKAEEYKASLQNAVEQIRDLSVALDGIEQRTKEFAWVLETLDERFQQTADRVSRMIGRIRRESQSVEPNVIANTAGPVPVPYAALTEKDRESFHLLIALGSTLYRTAKAVILDDDGRLSANGALAVTQVKDLLESL
ncbi:MAG TPA: hypothetical protein VNS29_13505 [Burkholderiaceae bacterium]|nr:hypothetical protein [Burkholderiaceae bacterium]